MKIILQRAAAGAAITIAFVASAASAQVIGPQYPAPGGNGASSNGQQAIGATGRIVRYTGFDANQFSELYWTYQWVNNPSVNNAFTGLMNFTSYNATTGISTWTSSAPLAFPSVQGPQSFFTTLLVQFQPHNTSVNNVMASGWIAPVTAAAAGVVGLPPNQSMMDNSAGANFQVWSQYRGRTTSGLGVEWDSYNHFGEQLTTSSNGQFYAVLATPEPASLVLMATGLVLVGGVVRSRRGKA